MGLLKILSAVAHKKLDSSATVLVAKTPTPLNLHQGSVVKLPEVDLALAQVDGSIIKLPTGDQVVSAVGRYSLFGKSIYHVYLGDGSNYLQLVCTGTEQDPVVEEVRLWSNYAEVVPQTAQDWEFWLGSYQKNSAGEFVRDENGNSLRAETGLIGWTQFQIDGPPPVVYDRAWYSSAVGVDPVSYTETIVSSNTTVSRVKHEAMEYHRLLTSDANGTVESLLATTSQTSDEAGINIWVGIKLNAAELKVLAA